MENIRKNILQKVGAILCVTSIAYFLYLAFNNTSALLKLEWSYITAGALIAASAMYSLQTVIQGINWYFLLNGSGQNVSLHNSVIICCLSQASKYIPGNIAHHVGRIWLSTRSGLSMPHVLATMFLETGLTVSTGFIVAGIALLVARDRLFARLPYMPSEWVFGTVALGVLIVSLLAYWFFERVPLRLKQMSESSNTCLRRPSVTVLGAYLLICISQFILNGVLMFILSRILFDSYGAGLLLMTGIFAIAWVVGFITPGAPAGLGIREIILVTALTTFNGASEAVSIAAALRIVTVMGDGLAFLIGLSGKMV